MIIQLFILSNKPTTLISIDNTNTVIELKKKHELTSYILFSGSKKLNDNETLIQQGIRNNSLIFANLIVQGGSNPTPEFPDVGMLFVLLSVATIIIATIYTLFYNMFQMLECFNPELVIQKCLADTRIKGDRKDFCFSKVYQLTSQAMSPSFIQAGGSNEDDSRCYMPFFNYLSIDLLALIPAIAFTIYAYLTYMCESSDNNKTNQTNSPIMINIGILWGVFLFIIVLYLMRKHIAFLPSILLRGSFIGSIILFVMVFIAISFATYSLISNGVSYIMIIFALSGIITIELTRLIFGKSKIIAGFVGLIGFLITCGLFAYTYVDSIGNKVC